MIEDSLEKIKNNADLDLPDLKEMVANGRCHEIMVQAYQHFEEELKALVSQSSEDEISDYKEKVELINNKCIKHYTSNASLYDPVIKDKFELELKS